MIAVNVETVNVFSQGIVVVKTVEEVRTRLAGPTRELIRVDLSGIDG